jgi:hypothetical protein
MKKLIVTVSAGLLAACAASDPAEVRAPRSESEYITGSRIPGKGPGAVTRGDKEEIERMRSTGTVPLPDHMKP